MGACRREGAADGLCERGEAGGDRRRPAVRAPAAAGPGGEHPAPLLSLGRGTEARRPLDTGAWPEPG